MINIADVVAQLIGNFPLHTDEFTELVDAGIDSAYVKPSKRDIVIEFDGDHGVTTGEKLIIAGAEVKNTIASFSVDDCLATVELDYEHDFEDGTSKKLVVDGTGTDYDGKHTILSVESNKSLIISAIAGVAAPSDGHVWEDRDYCGNQVATASVTSSSILEYAIDDDSPDLPPLELRNVNVIKGVRVAGCADPERSISMYSKIGAGKTWCFVMYPSDTVSHDRHALTDAVATFTAGDEGRIRMLSEFDIAVIMPVETMGGAEEVERMNGEIKLALIKSLFGIKDDDLDDGQSFRMVYTGSSNMQYDTTKLVRLFSFQVPHDFTFDIAEGATPMTVALRDALFGMQISDNDDAGIFNADVDVL